MGGLGLIDVILRIMLKMKKKLKTLKEVSGGVISLIHGSGVDPNKREGIFVKAIFGY